MIFYQKKIKKIPSFLSQYFWDVDVNKVDPQKNSYFVISRLLDKGDLKAVRWVKSHYSAPIIKICLQKYRDFSLKSASFWSLIYQVPKNKVKCFRKPFHGWRKKLWPY